MKPEQLPRTDSIQELARFWDSHDLTAFEDQLEEVKEPVFEKGRVISLCLDLSDADAVRKLAEKRGVAEAELIAEWVREKIQAK
jgi:hypothetical protein